MQVGKIKSGEFSVELVSRSDESVLSGGRRGEVGGGLRGGWREVEVSLTQTRSSYLYRGIR